MNLQRVQPGKYLHLPREISPNDKLWLEPGGVVDLDDPYVAFLIKGQEYKVSPDPSARAPSPVKSDRYEAARIKYMAQVAPAPVDKPVIDEAANARLADIPNPDKRPKREDKKNAQVPSPVS